jgi:predicted permease
VTVLSDFRYAARMLAKSPGLTLSAAGLLAAGIGGGTLIFTAFESVWLRPLPVRHPEQIVRMVQKVPQIGTRSYFTYAYYRALQEHSTTLSAEFGEIETTAPMSLPAPPEQVRLRMVTPEYLEQLGVPALYGRTLTPDDAIERPGAMPVVLSYAFWQRRFQGDPAAVGREITLRRNIFVIAGVMPRGFNGLSADNSPDVRAPLRAFGRLWPVEVRESYDEVQLDLAGRLKPGVTREQAEAECLALWRAMEKDPNELARGMSLDPMERGVSIVRDKYGDALRLLTAAAALILLMVCANVAGLMLAGAAARRSEIAVRLALGATRVRLARQMLAESLLLVALGAIGGLLIAMSCASLLVRALPPQRDLATTPLELTLDPTPDARVLLALLVAAAVTAVVIGLVPAMSMARTSLDSVLRGVRASHSWSGRGALVVFQVALCTLLVAGASLLVSAFRHLRSVDPGFDSGHIVTFSATPSFTPYSREQSRAFWQAWVARVRDLPGVVAVAASARPLMRGSGWKNTVAAEGQSAPRSDFLNTSSNNVTAGYFDAMGMHIVRGRDFTAGDLAADNPTPENPAPAVVNEAFARRFFPGVDPVGRRFGNGLGVAVKGTRVIIGVVGDAKYRSLREPMTPTYYSAGDADFNVLAVRTRRAPQEVMAPVRQALAALDSALPLTEVHTMAAEVEASTAAERLTASLGSVFGAFAALLAAAGLYGLLAFAVEQRRREIGIRMALGAQRSDISAMLAGQAGKMVAGGVLLGLIASLAAGRWLRALLYGISASDPWSLAAAAALMALVAAAATLIPARRATRVEPASALRE